MLRAFLFLALLPIVAGAQSVSCPASIKVTETAQSLGTWKGSSATSTRTLDRVSIYNGKDGGKEYDLAPDDQQHQGKKIVSTWNLKDYRDLNISMRCRYKGTEAVLSMDLPPALKTCTFTFELDAKGNTVGTPSVVCK